MTAISETISEEVKSNVGTSDNAEQNVKLPKELMAKHPLQNKWVIWFYKNDKSKSWAANLRKITAFDTVEDFWAVYNHIQLASRLAVGCDYSFFKEGIEPMWEDKQNRLGGRWLVNLSRTQRNLELDKLWLETLLCLIGEAFDDDSEQVCGGVVNIRPKGDKIAVWTAFADRPESVLKIGKTFKERLTLPHKFNIVYEKHMDTANKSGSQTKNQFTV